MDSKGFPRILLDSMDYKGFHRESKGSQSIPMDSKRILNDSIGLQRTPKNSKRPRIPEEERGEGERGEGGRGGEGGGVGSARIPTTPPRGLKLSHRGPETHKISNRSFSSFLVFRPLAGNQSKHLPGDSPGTPGRSPASGEH